MTDKLKMQSMDKVQYNIEKIREMFPNAVTEVKRGEKTEFAVDFDVLKQELADTLIDERELRYQFTWPDKQKSILLANTSVTATLRPDKEKSVDFDNTQNLYIEGDNLDVLKLLRETYLGKIKMIYIDPPYNTGNDFVYEDDFALEGEEYKYGSGQYDEERNRLFQNTESNGRFHTDWLNMIYPRLKVAKDLLSDDGVIFISIDDNEQANLKKICDEVFGAGNCVATIKILSNPRGRQSTTHFANAGEYVLVFAKNKAKVVIFGETLDESTKATYNKKDEKGFFRDLGLRKRGSDSRREDSPTLFFPIYFNPITQDIALEKQDGYLEIIPKLEDGSLGRWRWSPAKIRSQKELLYAREVLRNGSKEYDIFQKDYLDASDTVKHKDFWVEKEINYDRSSDELRALFVDRIFDFAKPIYLIKKLIKTVSKEGDIILDFFSGSATTAHAVMQLNAEDGGNRKFIMVQLPEPCDEKSEAYKAGYKTICDIGEERIRRAGQKIKAELEKPKQQSIYQGDSSTALRAAQNDAGAQLDIGFRVLRLDSSNMREIYYHPEQYSQTLLDDLTDNIKEDRTPLDLLFQVMLDLGVKPSAKIEEKDIAGKRVFVVNENELIACFDDEITDEVVKAIAQMQPLYAAFRDSSYVSDSVAANFEQIFATYSPNTRKEIL